MTWDIGSTGIQILLGFSIAFGAAAQLVVGRRGPSWLWLAAAVGWLVGGIVASEVIVGTMTVEEIQPIIDGLAFDEALLGGLLGGLVAVVAARVVARPLSPQPSRTRAPA